MGMIGDAASGIIGGIGGLFGGKSGNDPERWGATLQDLGMGDLAYYMSLFGDPMMQTYFTNNKDANAGFQNTFGVGLPGMVAGGIQNTVDPKTNPYGGYGVQRPMATRYSQPPPPSQGGGISLQGGGGSSGGGGNMMMTRAGMQPSGGMFPMQSGGGGGTTSMLTNIINSMKKNKG